MSWTFKSLFFCWGALCAYWDSPSTLIQAVYNSASSSAGGEKLGSSQVFSRNMHSPEFAHSPLDPQKYVRALQSPLWIPHTQFIPFMFWARLFLLLTSIIASENYNVKLPEERTFPNEITPSQVTYWEILWLGLF